MHVYNQQSLELCIDFMRGEREREREREREGESESERGVGEKEREREGGGGRWVAEELGKQLEGGEQFSR